MSWRKYKKEFKNKTISELRNWTFVITEKPFDGVPAKIQNIKVYKAGGHKVRYEMVVEPLKTDKVVLPHFNDDEEKINDNGYSLSFDFGVKPQDAKNIKNIIWE